MDRYKTRHPRVSVLLFLIFIVVPFIGCGGGGGGGGSSQQQSGPQGTIDTVILASSRNDNTAIASNFTPAAQIKYQSYFSDLSKMREFGDSLKEAVPVDMKDNLAIYKSSFFKDGVEYSYFIYLIKNENGKWQFDIF